MLDPGLIDQMAVEIADAQLRRMPELARRYGAIGRLRCIEDTTFHLRYLDAAVTLDDATLFGDYIAWAKVMLASRGVGENDLLENLHGFAPHCCRMILPTPQRSSTRRLAPSRRCRLPSRRS